MVVRTFLRLIISLVGALVPLLFLSGSYSPLSAYLPMLPNFLGQYSGLYNSLQGSLGTTLPVGVLPFGTAGITGVALYSVIQRFLGSAKAMTYSRPNMDISQMMRSLQGSMPMMSMQAGPAKNLPQDMSKSQYLILMKYRDGHAKPENVAKSLSMDQKAVEEQTRILQNNGYLTDNHKLTSKGLETLS
jgi:hypothetical protein